MKKRLALLCILPAFAFLLTGCSTQTQSDLTLRGPVAMLNSGGGTTAIQEASDGTAPAERQLTADHLLALVGMRENDLVATLGEGRRAAGSGEGFRAYQKIFYDVPGTIAVSFDHQRVIDTITLVVDRSEESHWIGLLQTKFGQLTTQNNVTRNMLENHEVNVAMARLGDDLLITFSRSNRPDGTTV